MSSMSPVLQDVSNEPPFSPGSFDSSSTIPGREAGPRGAARGVTVSRSSGTSLAKPVCADRGEDLPGQVLSSCQTAESGKLSGSAFVRSDYRHTKKTAQELSGLVMAGDLDLAIRDLTRCRSYSCIPQALRLQLGRCLFELHTARRML